MTHSPLITPNELQALHPDTFRLVEAGSGDSAYEHYLNEHLPGALYVDLNRDLAEPVENPANGGRHPLPTVEKFSELLRRLGLDRNSKVVVYDDKNASNAAARFWWMLRAAGINHVQVLDGGFQNAKKYGLSVTAEPSCIPLPSEFTFSRWQLALADISLVERFSKNSEGLIIDVREQDRYDGRLEPIDEVAGHIPGAVSVFFKHNLKDDGTFKNPDDLRKLYGSILEKWEPDNTVVHCGSGVTACHTLLALEYAGYQMPKLYVGSWSEWSRSQKPIATNI